MDLAAVLRDRLAEDPFHGVATLIFALAICHTFAAARIAAMAQRAPQASMASEVLPRLGEVEAIFGLWAVPLLVALSAVRGWHATTEYFKGTIAYTEAMFVVGVEPVASGLKII